MSLIQRMFDGFKPLILRRNLDPYIIKGIWRAAPVAFFTLFYYSWIDFCSDQSTYLKLYDLQLAEVAVQNPAEIQVQAKQTLANANNQSKQHDSDKQILPSTEEPSLNILNLAVNLSKSSQKQSSNDQKI